MSDADPALPEIPLWVRLTFAGASSLVAALAAEGVVRIADGNALPNLGIFSDMDGRIALEPNACARLRRFDGGTYSICTDENGLRADPSATNGLIVGDSQVLGMGVEGAETFAARAGFANAGVPGYGVADAAARAEELLPLLHPKQVVFIVNQANDWEEGVERIETRNVVRGGWLLTAANAHGSAAAFWASPLSRVHMLYLGFVKLSSGPANPADTVPMGLRDAASLAAITTALAGEVTAFAHAHAEISTLAAFLPVDAATSEARAALSPFPHTGQPWADRALRDQLAVALGDVPMVDLVPALTDPACFLAHDYHLSPTGHERVAAALSAFVPPSPPTEVSP